MWSRTLGSRGWAVGRERAFAVSLRRTDACRGLSSSRPVLVYQPEMPLDEINQKIVNFGKAKELDRAFGMYNYIINELYMAPSCKTVALLIDACTKSQAVERGFDLFYQTQADGLQPDVDVYNALLGLCSATSKYDRAALILQQMRERSITPDLITVHRLIQLALQAGKVEEAVANFDRIQTLPFDATVVTYNLMIQGLLRGDRKSVV